MKIIALLALVFSSSAHAQFRSESKVGDKTFVIYTQFVPAKSITTSFEMMPMSTDVAGDYRPHCEIGATVNVGQIQTVIELRDTAGKLLEKRESGLKPLALYAFIEHDSPAECNDLPKSFQASPGARIAVENYGDHFGKPESSATIFVTAHLRNVVLEFDAEQRLNAKVDVGTLARSIEYGGGTALYYLGGDDKGMSSLKEQSSLSFAPYQN